MNRRPRFLLAALAILALTLVGTGSAMPALARDPLALGISTDGNGRDLGMLDQLHSDIGAWPATWSVWSQWGSRGGKSDCMPGSGTCAFPEQTLLDLATRGGGAIIPVIWWEPWNPGKSFSFQGRWARYDRILGHQHDVYIEDWAKAAADYGGRIILRFAHEANGHWFPWGIGNFDNTVSNFKAAWRYVRRKFRRAGADNVEFLWSVSKQDCLGCNAFKAVFPGGRYVDWAGITAFNWGAQKAWRSMPAILARPIGEMRKVTKTKIIVAEIASHYRPSSKSKASWIRQGYQDVYERWPFIKGVIYLDAVGPHQTMGHPDWRLTKPNDLSALHAYADISAMGKFQGSLPAP